jgi:hypothetical protein
MFGLKSVIRKNGCPMSPSIVLALALALLAARPLSAEPLPALGADPNRTTVSGLSSGAYMAGQFQVAYSHLVKGAGLVAGGPYACAHTPGSDFNPYWPLVLTWNLTRARTQCMQDGWLFSNVPSPATLFGYAKDLAERGGIDPVSGLADDKVYLFSSAADDRIETGVVEAANRFYREAGVPEANIRFEKHGRAAHAFLTEDDAPACGTPGAPYLNDCDIDQAKAILEWLMGPLQPAGTADPRSFAHFEQAPFADDPGAASLDNEGIAYVPQGCRTQPGCAVHVVFHGCKQGLAAVGERFAKGAGYARWAESNAIVLLFPQTASSAFNPDGCWDWWGYTGPRFLERDAPQMLAVKRMLDRLAERP